MEELLADLYEKTGTTSVLPTRADKSFKVDGKEVNLNSAQYVTYAKTRGTTAYQLLTIITGRSAFRSLTPDAQAKLVADVYEYANAIAKSKVSSYKLSGWLAKAKDAETGAADYILDKYTAKK
jgi:hypothetical protein